MVQGCEIKVKGHCSLFFNLEVRSTPMKGKDQEGVRRRWRRRVGVYDRPAAHKSIPDWLKENKPLPCHR